MSETAGEGRWEAFCWDRLESLAFRLTRPSLIQSCCNASSGVIRMLGSHLQRNTTCIHPRGDENSMSNLRVQPIQWFDICCRHVEGHCSYSKHLLMKSRKLASHVLTACWRSLEPTRLFFPLLLVIHRGLPLESVKTGQSR